MATQTTEFVVAVVHSRTDIELLAHTEATLRPVGETADVAADWVRREILRLHESRMCSLILVSREVELAKWTRHEPTGGGDPFFRARLGPLELTVSVEGTPWAWTWTVAVFSDDPLPEPLARGRTYVDHDQDEWNYQGYEVAQGRCEAVAEALIPHLEKRT